jgi:CubicO group peptidase (beta-lactamase class C family)
MQRRYVFAVLALACAAQPLASQKHQALPRSDSGEIDSLVSGFMARTKVPGLSVAVAVDGQLRWDKGYGLADIENSVPARSSTVYRLASVSKPITAVAALQLAEQGMLDLDAPIQKYVPDFPKKPWPVTTRALLAHLGGIRHYSGPAEFNSTRHYASLSEPLEIFQKDPLVAEPGTAYHYTTYGYVLAGAVVESACAMRFTDCLGERIFKPAGMKYIRSDDVFAIIPHRARGYRLTPYGELENCAPADTSNKIPGGGLSATAADLVRFAIAVRNGKLLKPETVRKMLEPQQLRNGKETDYGLGWAIMGDRQKRLIGHSGGQQGVSTMLLMDPTQGNIVAVMANLEGARVEELSVGILRILGH